MRVVMMEFIDLNLIKRRVLVLGSAAAAAKVRRLRRRADRRRFEVLGFVALSDLDRRGATRFYIAPLLSLEEARKLVSGPDEIVVALDHHRWVGIDTHRDCWGLGIRTRWQH
jgi:hypothetical protein